MATSVALGDIVFFAEAETPKSQVCMTCGHCTAESSLDYVPAIVIKIHKDRLQELVDLYVFYSDGSIRIRQNVHQQVALGSYIRKG